MLFLLVPVSYPTNDEDMLDEPPEGEEPDNRDEAEILEEPQDKKTKINGKFYLEHYIVV